MRTLVPFLLARGEFSIIIVNLAIAGGLMSVLQPFAALFVLISVSASPLFAKESERIHGLFVQQERRSVPQIVDHHTAAARFMEPLSEGETKGGFVGVGICDL